MICQATLSLGLGCHDKHIPIVEVSCLLNTGDSQSSKTTTLHYIEIFSLSNSKANELWHLLFGGLAIAFIVVLKKILFQKITFQRWGNTSVEVS